MEKCRKCTYKSRENCLCTTEIYIERFYAWSNRDNDCEDYREIKPIERIYISNSKISLVEQLKRLEREKIISGVIMNLSALALRFIS